ncbi:hypothetical protein GALMADRAFT_1328780 [Galerina marginata CBS 339.88]|uniref:Uncharacterized protein n=1 Tax=Galerina marginata (strain CBS 339.88) TaxID=685588 RepID=A0A067T0Z9_GALM3|nr:hypothetical protein GALMADRAFT_1328780 [Galerina marginata CBS 339.88]
MVGIHRCFGAHSPIKFNLQTIPSPASSRDPYSTRHVQFTQLRFGTKRTTEAAYKQFYVSVTVNAGHENAGFYKYSPKRSLASEKEEKQLLTAKTGQTRSLAAALVIGPHPQATLTANKTKADEKTSGFERKQLTSRIRQRDEDGMIQWGFDLDDVNEQEEGTDMSDNNLPTVCIEFPGDDPKAPPPPPERLGIEIGSYWSIRREGKKQSSWIRKILNLSSSSGGTQDIFYSNMCHIVALKANPSVFPPRSDYAATIDVRPEVSDTDYGGRYYPKVTLSTTDSVEVEHTFTPGKFRTLLTF